MSMSSFEVVRRAIEFEIPDRLPLNVPLLGMSDFHSVGWNQIGTGDRAYRQTYDEWGCLWVRSEVENMGQIKGHPIASWDDLGRYRWPDPDDPSFYTGLEQRLEGGEGKFILTSIFMLLFERMHGLRGFENTLTDLYLEQEKIERLADRIVEFDLRIMENIASRLPGQIHGFAFTDDWGTEQASFIHPRLWDEFFKPRYAAIFNRAHEYGWKVWMHSCGKINDLLDSLIAIGCDVIEPQQPRALGIESIGSKFRGKICFASLCDIQHTLPFASDEAIRQEARLLLQEWATPEGGFILIDYGDGAAIGVPLQRKEVMLEAFLSADPWKQQLQTTS